MTESQHEASSAGELDRADTALGYLFALGFVVAVSAWVYGLMNVQAGKLGEFGDFISGTVNPLLSLMTLYALGRSVVMQAKQLRLSREELGATRAELARTAEAQESAAKLMAEQLKAAKDAATAQHWAADAQARSAEALTSQARQAGHAAHIAALNSALAAVTQHVEHFDRHVANNPGVSYRVPADIEKARERQARLRAEIATFTDHLLGVEAFEFDNDPEASGE